MFISIVMTLRSRRPTQLPAYLGRANQAEVLKRIRPVNADLAHELHTANGQRPMVCSGLLNAHDGQIKKDVPYFWRVTGLNAEVGGTLRAALVENRPAVWCLSGHQFDVTEVLCDDGLHEWSGQTDANHLAARHMLTKELPRESITLEFVSPTAFRSQSMTVPFPLPALVFGSLLDRWNAFAPIALEPEVREKFGTSVAVSKYNLRTVPVSQKQKGLHVGSVGRVTYLAQHLDRYQLALFHLLADFAFYSGVGIKTTSGMGQVRKVSPSSAGL